MIQFSIPKYRFQTLLHRAVQEDRIDAEAYEPETLGGPGSGCLGVHTENARDNTGTPGGGQEGGQAQVDIRGAHAPRSSARYARAYDREAYG